MSDAPGAVLRGAIDLSSLRNRPAQQAPNGAGAAPGGLSPVMDITDADFPHVIELSRTVPVILELFDQAAGPTAALSALVQSLAGRLVLARADIAASPQVAQALRPQATPMAVALIAAQPVPLFAGPVTEDQLREVLPQVLQLAAQHGVAGTVPVGAPDQGDAGTADAEPELPPLHAEAYAAIEQGDYPAAVAAYERALAENPRDTEAQAGLGQVRLLQRVQGADLQEARAAAAAAPTSLAAQLLVADLDITGGHVEDAFDRLLELFAAVDTEQRGAVRERLLELFAIVGESDPRVSRARSRLTSLLF